MRFIQFADVHLDSYIGGAIGLSREKADALKSDLRAAFARACALAVDRHADVVLIPGDLFDYETATPETTAFVQRTLAEIAPTPVFIAPGNHDSLRAGSPYHGSWPSNVHIFRAPEFETTVITELSCSVTGIAHAHRGITDRLLARPLNPAARAMRILLFHGSRDGYPSEKETVIPFSDAELLSQSFTYAAIGHYHSFASINDDKSRIRGAYSGCVQGRGLDETGEKCVIVGEISDNGLVELERVEVAERRIVRAEVDVTGSRDGTEILARMDAAASAKARPSDVVCIFLKGMLPNGIDPDMSLWQSRQPYFASAVNVSAVEPDYDLAAMGRDSAASSLRNIFVRKMLERQQQATDQNEKHVLQDAIYYGLYALDGRKLEPRDAN